MFARLPFQLLLIGSIASTAATQTVTPPMAVQVEPTAAIAQA